MSSMAPLVKEYVAPVVNAAAGADFETVMVVAPFAGTLVGASYIPDTNITGADTDSRTLQVINKGADGNGTTVMASLAHTSGVDATDFNEEALTLSATPANLVFAAGDVLVWKSLHVGSTGLADPGGSAKLQISRS